MIQEYAAQEHARVDAAHPSDQPDGGEAALLVGGDASAAEDGLDPLHVADGDVCDEWICQSDEGDGKVAGVVGGGVEGTEGG